METILTIIAAVFGFLTTWYSPGNQEARREKEREKRKNEIRKAIESGDVDALNKFLREL